MTILPVNDPAFAPYGRVIAGYDTACLLYTSPRLCTHRALQIFNHILSPSVRFVKQQKDAFFFSCANTTYCIYLIPS